MKKKIWIWNHYAAKMFIQQGGRHYWFAKYLVRAGYDVSIFCASSVHGNDYNLNQKNELYTEQECDGFHFVFVRTDSYLGNGMNRVKNMIQFYKNVQRVAKKLEWKSGKPDVVLASSVHPLTLVAGIKYCKTIKVPCVCEVRDLWPASIVAYSSKLSERNLLIKLLYQGEKWIYKKANALIFTMEGGRQYILDKGWNKEQGGPVDLNKVYYINNGVDLEAYDYNKNHNTFADVDLDDRETIKVMYTGSIRKANTSVLILPEVARALQSLGRNDIKILVYGKGDYEDELCRKCNAEGLRNIVFKGFVEKNYIPYVLSKADINILNCADSDVSKYGGSQNKLFEYLASGKPILSAEESRYSIINNEQCGISRNYQDAQDIAETIIALTKQTHNEHHVRAVGECYDFKKHTERLISILEN